MLPRELERALLDLEHRLGAEQTLLYFVGTAARAAFLLDELAADGWKVSRGRRTAELNGRTVHVLLPWRGDAVRGRVIHGYAADEGVQLSEYLVNCVLRPCMLGTRRRGQA